MKIPASSLSDEFLLTLEELDGEELNTFESLYPGLIDLIYQRRVARHKAKKVENDLTYRKRKDDVLRAYRSHTETIEDTCYSYREKRREFYRLRRNRYNRLQYLQRSTTNNLRKKHSRWLSFKLQAIQYHYHLTRSWLPDPDSDWPAIYQQLLANPLDLESRFNGIKFPWCSSCHIDPQPTPEWLLAQEQKAQKFYIESKLDKINRILTRLEKKHGQQ